MIDLVPPYRAHPPLPENAHTRAKAHSKPGDEWRRVCRYDRTGGLPVPSSACWEEPGLHTPFPALHLPPSYLAK